MISPINILLLLIRYMIILSTHKTEISSKRTSLIISKICTYYFREFKTGQFVMRVNRDEKHLHNF